MDLNRKLGHIVAYYLSRFDKVAREELGCKTDKAAFAKVGAALGIPANYIKFRRDEFDVFNPHRQGWHKRPASLSIINTVTALQDLDEFTLREIVKEILHKGSTALNQENTDRLASVFPVDEKKKKRNNKPQSYIPRGITGKKAEEIFLNWYPENSGLFPETGELKDTRDHGCGYDFELKGSGDKKYFIEVKGLASDDGGILFTNKEWETALIKRESYYVVLVTNVDKKPIITIIQNPALNLNPKMNLTTIIQVSWNVSAGEINEVIVPLIEDIKN